MNNMLNDKEFSHLTLVYRHYRKTFLKAPQDLSFMGYAVGAVMTTPPKGEVLPAGYTPHSPRA